MKKLKLIPPRVVEGDRWHESGQWFTSANGRSLQWMRRLETFGGMGAPDPSTGRARAGNLRITGDLSLPSMLIEARGTYG
ncbi:MAG TPA: hypothetical protein VKB87_03300 [Myxococcaceae bacterium]|nr:hypothetical protein [Myxococcaceae bacterium]